MNKSFKVVFNKARGTLMAVNEVTSSVQAKGVKTVVAAAAAFMTAGAMAATGWTAAPEGAETKAPATWTFEAENYAFNLDKGANNPNSFLSASDKDTSYVFDKNLWVKGANTGTQATGIWAAGADVTATNTGVIYVTAEDGANSWSQHALSAANGATVVNDGSIFAKNAYGMSVGTSKNGDAAAHLVNNSTISVEVEGAGIELGGVSGSDAVNNGTISVGAKSDGHFTLGVLIKDQKDGVFTNKGVISAKDATAAISIQKTDSTSGAVINLEGTSKVEGAISNDAEDTKFNIKNNTDTLTIQTTGGELNVLDGSVTTLVDGQASTFAKTNVTNAQLNASIWQADNVFKTVNVNEGGVFNVTKLNAGGDADQTAENAKPHDTLLLKNGFALTLNGGKLYQDGSEFTGQLKVGTASGEASSLTVQNGSALKLDSLQVQQVGTVNIESTGSVTTGKLILSKGTVNLNGGSLTVTEAGGFTRLVPTKPAVLNLQNGTFTVDGASLFTKVEGADASYEATDAAKTIQGTGTVKVTDSFEYSLAQLKKAQELLNTVENSDVKLVFANGTLKLAESESLTDQTVDGLLLADETAGTTTDGTFSVAKSTTLAAVDFGGKTAADKADSVALAGNGALTLSGNKGGVFAGLADTVKTVNAENLVLGTDASSKGTVNVDTLSVKNLTVNGAFDATNVSVATAATVASGASLALETIEGAGTVTVAGTLAASQFKAAVTTQGAALLVIGERIPAPAAEGAALVSAKAAATQSLLPQIAGVVTAKEAGALVTTNADGEALFNAALARNGVDFDAKKNVGVYVDGTIAVDGTAGKLLVGNVLNAKAAGTAAFAKDTVVVIDTTKFGAADTVFDATLSMSGDAPVVLDGITTASSFILATKSDKTGADLPNINFVDNTALFDGVVSKNADEALVVTLAFNENVTNDAALNAVLKTELDGKHNQKNADVLAAIANTQSKSGLVAEDGKSLTDLGAKAAAEYLVAPVVAGSYNVAYDASSEVTGAVNRRAVAKDSGVWADVFYASTEDKAIYGDQGYSADIYGGTLGFDAAFACGAKVGAAFTIGTADADSERSAFAYSTDSDFYGVSVYASKNVADTSLKFSADASYLWFENDLKGNVAGVSADESIDSNVFTVGLRADWTAYQNGALTVAPHAGLRYTSISVDDYRGLKTGDLNVVEMPFGIKVSGVFEPSAGWKVAPAFDFTAVPEIGDKEVGTVLGDVNVIDNLYNAALGVEASSGNFTFGLNYKYGFGKEDRTNNAFSANVRYAF